MKKFFLGACASALLFALIATIYLLYPRKERESPHFEKQVTTTEHVESHWKEELPSTKEIMIDHILSQPFTFLARGKQSSAYISKDGFYVIKFLRQKPLAIKEQYEKLPNIYPFTVIKERLEKERRKRRDELFSSLLISYQIIPEQAGIIFLHLTKAKPLHKKLFIIDSAYDPHVLDVDSVQWVLQKKAQMVKVVLAELMWEGDVDTAKLRIDQLFTLLHECAKAEVVDIDPNLVKNDNIGFVQDRAIYIDVGKLRKASKPVSKLEFAKDLDRLKKLSVWLNTYYPQLGKYFEMKKQQVINAY